MKLKNLLALAAIAVGSTALAQTDVTSTYLTNPSFELKAEGTTATAEALTNAGTYYGWNLPNLGTQFVNISIGDGANCNGQAFGIPSAMEGSTYYYCRRGWNSNSSADATLATSATLPAGDYKLTINYMGLDSWDSSHNSKGSNLTLSAEAAGSVLASSKTANFDAVNGNAAGANRFAGNANWKETSLSFTVAEEGEVKLNFIHHLVGGVRTDVVIDNLVLLFISPLDKAKEDAIAALPAPTDAFFGLDADKIDGYKAQIDEATSEEAVAAIMEEVNAYEAPAFSGSWNIKNVNAGIYMGNAVLTEIPTAITFEKADNGVYIKVGDKYINMKGNNNWDMIAEDEAKTAWTFTLNGDNYTITGPKGMIGSDATVDGSPLYGDKNASKNGLWTISEAVSEEEIELAKAKNELQSLIGMMPIPTANIEGETESIIYWGSESVNNLKNAIEAANDILENSNDVEAVKTCIEDLKELVCITSAPDSNTPYNIVMAKEGLGWAGNAVTFTYGSNTQNNYAMAYSEAPGESNFNQAVYFDINDEGDLYMYIIDAAGKEWCVTDGTHVGSTVSWAPSQLRMSDNLADAMPISINPSFTLEGVCEIINEWTGEHIGSTNNNGFYCSNDNYDLSIVPAVQKTTTVTLAATYGTVILPSEYGVAPEGIKFYAVSSVNNDSELVLTEEETVKTNTPYIMEGEEGASFTCTGYANAFNSEYTAGLLTGVFADTKAPKGSYVLQNQDDNVAFYLVDSNITVPAGKAYLTAPASEAKVLNISANATAINAIEALTSGKAEIYSANGAKQNKLAKGVNILNVNGKTVKVLVK